MFYASCIWKGHSETVELLLRNGAKDIPDKVINKHSIDHSYYLILYSIIQDGDTALDMAKKDNHREVIRLFQRYQN